MQKKEDNYQIISTNKRARFDYELLTEYEAGIILTGSEVKSMRVEGCSLSESYITYNNKDIELVNMYIPPYKHKNAFSSNHDSRRPRKLLLHKHEISKCIKKLYIAGLAGVPQVIYFNHRGLVKVKFSIGKGKKAVDKRETIKKRDIERDIRRTKLI